MGGMEMEVGVLFADVRGFTSLAEHRRRTRSRRC